MIESFLWCTETFCFVRSHLSVMGPISCATGVLFKKSLLVPVCWRILPSFSSSSLKVIGFILRSLTHLFWKKNSIPLNKPTHFLDWTYSHFIYLFFSFYLFIVSGLAPLISSLACLPLEYRKTSDLYVLNLHCWESCHFVKSICPIKDFLVAPWRSLMCMIMSLVWKYIFTPSFPVCLTLFPSLVFLL